MTRPIEAFTVSRYQQLGEIGWCYTELVDGRLLLAPNPGYEHQRFMGELMVALRSAEPDDLTVLHAIDVDLGLAPPDAPGFSRRPDIVVIDRAEFERVGDTEEMIRASGVRLVVEIVSPCSRRIDNVDKRRDYADAGIPYYWIIDLDDPISLVACHLTEEFGYVDHQTATGTFTTDVPFRVEIDLDALLD